MEWEELLAPRRLRESTSGSIKTGDRSDFQRDYDRIVFSSPFRSLQQKTQVIPFPKTDFVHSRLTHSLETASVGRSLGSGFFAALKELGSTHFEVMQGLGYSGYELGAIVAAAALAHDIGNPPFGHSGEDAISDYFEGEGAALLEGLSSPQQADFLHFEGNAAGFRILTHTPSSVGSLEGGLNLTFPVLASFMKYPCPVDKVDKTLGKASRKKFGVYQSELSYYDRIFTSIGLKQAGEQTAVRHPLAFLTEAADDICYRIIDLEDACRLGWVSITEVEELLRPILDPKTFDQVAHFKDINEKVGYYRASAINTLVSEGIACAVEHVDAMFTQSFDESLSDFMPSKTALEEIYSFSIERIYNHTSVVENELAGKKVIQRLLHTFSPLVIQPDSKDARKLGRLVPLRFKNRSGKYEQVMGLVEFLASMSDKSALALYRQLEGIS